MVDWSKNIAKLRREYGKDSFNINDALENPMDQFELWFDDAVKSKLPEPNRFVLSTVGESLWPSSRVLLMKNVINNKFIFYTNYKSKKAQEILYNNNVSLNFHWYEMERQVRIQGTAARVNDKISDEYFQSRSLSSRIGAIVSKQSHELKNKKQFLKEVLEEGVKTIGNSPDRPDHWGGYEIDPVKIEFWQGRKSRLHDRILYEKKEGVWSKKLLYP